MSPGVVLISFKYFAVSFATLRKRKRKCERERERERKLLKISFTSLRKSESCIKSNGYR